MGPWSTRPRDHPAGAGLRRGPRQETPRRTDTVDTWPYAPPDAGMCRAAGLLAGVGVDGYIIVAGYKYLWEWGLTDT